MRAHIRTIEEYVQQFRNEGPWLRRGYCEWGVGAAFGDSIRACGREGHGYTVRLCWQHRDMFYDEFLAQLVARPSMHFSTLIAAWISSALSDYEPDWWSDDERAEQAEVRGVANGVVPAIAEQFDFDSLPVGFKARLDARLNQLIDLRFNEEWSA